MTRQREAVFNALHDAGRPLSPSEILAVAQRAVPSLVLSTVYRNIRALVQDGGVSPVVLPGQPDRYAVAGTANAVTHRHYFQCRSCDRVFPLDGCPGHLDEIAPEGFEVEHHEITLLGRCADCARAAKGRLSRRRAVGS